MRVEPIGTDFEHNCDTGPGSAGAAVIGVSDDSLLGIHYERHDNISVAARLPGALLDELRTSQLP